jgi:hypothetical protein
VRLPSLACVLVLLLASGCGTATTGDTTAPISIATAPTTITNAATTPDHSKDRPVGAPIISDDQATRLFESATGGFINAKRTPVPIDEWLAASIAPCYAAYRDGLARATGRVHELNAADGGNGGYFFLFGSPADAKVPLVETGNGLKCVVAGSAVDLVQIAQNPVDGPTYSEWRESSPKSKSAAYTTLVQYGNVFIILRTSTQVDVATLAHALASRMDMI